MPCTICTVSYTHLPDHYALVSYLIDLLVSQSSALMPLHSDVYKRQEYVNVISRHQVIQKDKNGKAWMIMGVMDIAPDQTPMERIKRTVINRKTGEILALAVVPADQQLTKREKEILDVYKRQQLYRELLNNRIMK